jgi:DNA-binding NarL/FixJ family response regulator
LGDVRVGALDHRDLILAGIEAILKATPGITVIGTASDPVAARMLLARTKPDVFILSLDVPTEPGTILASQIRTVSNQTAILAMTEHPNPMLAAELIDMGAKGLVATTVPRRRLVADVLARRRRFCVRA